MRGLILAVLITGCAGSEPFVRQLPVPGKGVIYVYRLWKFQGAGFKKPATLTHTVSGQMRKFPLRVGKYVVTIADPGRTMFSIQGPEGEGQNLMIDVTPGSTTYICCDFEMGFLLNGFKCGQVAPEQGENEAAQCQRNVMGD
jgi:hypothetical protein